MGVNDTTPDTRGERTRDLYHLIDFLFNSAGNAEEPGFAQIARVGDWFSAAGWTVWQLALACGLAAVLVAWSLKSNKRQSLHQRTAAPLSTTRRCVIGVLQWLFVSLLLLLLWQPALRLDSLVKGDNTVAVLVDTSSSMLMPISSVSSAPSASRELLESNETSPNGASLGQTSRGQTPPRQQSQDEISRLLRVQQILNNSASDSTSLLMQLERSFSVALKTFDQSIDSATNETIDQIVTGEQSPGNATRLRHALLDTLGEASQTLLAGVVVFSDGADTEPADAAFWQSLRAASVPVYTIGVGETQPHDLKIARVDMPGSAPADTLITAQLQLQYREPGATTLRVTRNDQLLYSGQVNLPSGKNLIRHNVSFRSGESGVAPIEFSVEAQPGERVLVNNRHREPLLVTEHKPRILYIEGEPRWEYKFLRRAVTGSGAVDVVSLLYTSPNKFYRQGVSGPDELNSGFPADAATLFTYDAIIVGSLDASLLTPEQHQLIQDFVRVRGGSLLMLAGRQGLDEGGWTTTAVGQALPVTTSEETEHYRRDRVQLALTQAGGAVDWLSLAPPGDSDATSASLASQWRSLPAVADIQMTGEPKAGATVLLTSEVDDATVPVLSWQRYGRGRAFVLATSGTWRWQMSLPASDERHERFWAGLLSELSDGVLPAVALSASTRVARDADTLTLTIDARTDRFTPNLNPNPVTVTLPDRTKQTLNLQSVPSVAGRYQVNVPLPQSGLYTVAVNNDGVTVSDEDSQAVVSSLAILQETGTAEAFTWAQDQTFLQEVARVTGGEYLSVDAIDVLPELVEAHSATQTRETVHSLWSMPVFWLLLVMLKLGEWLLRRYWNRL